MVNFAVAAVAAVVETAALHVVAPACAEAAASDAHVAVVVAVLVPPVQTYPTAPLVPFRHAAALHAVAVAAAGDVMLLQLCL